MKHTLTRAALVVLVLLAAGTPAQAVQIRQQDFGERDDADARAEVHLWPRESLRIGTDPGDYVQTEDRKNFTWCTKSGGGITARVVQAGNAVEVRARAFSDPPGRIHLQVRFKDHLRAPASVWALTRDGWLHLGGLGGAFDHAWKTQTFSVQGTLAEETDGAYRFRIGAEQGGDVVGEIPIDRVRVADAVLPAEPSRPGYFPAPLPTKFGALAATKVYAPGGRPTFPVGVVVPGARTSTWDQAKALGVDVISLAAWDYDWRSHWRVYSDGRYIDRVDAGLPEWVARAKDAGLRTLPTFASDGFAWFIRRVYGSERGAVAAIADVIRQNRKADGVLAWVTKTAADSGAVGMGCPLEYAMDLANAKRKADPDRPGVVILTGRKPGTFRYFADAADVLGFDLAPFAEGLPLPVIGNILDDARRAVGGEKALWAFLEAHTPEGARRLGRPPTADEVAAQAYVAIAHGADGVFFVVQGDGEFLDLSEIAGPAAGVRRVAGDLLSGDVPLARALLPPSVTIDRMGEKGVVTCDDPNIHHVTQKDRDGFWYLIAVNASPERRASVRFACRSFPGGATAVVQREERVIGMVPGALVDSFDGYARHVYRILP
jgi:hypothetical protein